MINFLKSTERKHLIIGLLAGILISFIMVGLWTMTPTKVAFQLPAEKIYAEYRNNELSANHKYINEIIEVKGKIEQVIRKNADEVNVILRANGTNFGVVCTIKNLASQIDRPLKQGSDIIVKGNCFGFDLDVLLLNCVVVKQF